MPGSPPIRIIDPGTSPPPRTKSNSGSPVRQRSSGWVATSRRRAGGATRRVPVTLRPPDRPPARPPARPSSFRLLPIRQIVEPRVLPHEPELHVARGPVPVLGQHHLSHSPLRLVLPVVVLGPMDEDDEVGV